MEKINGLIKALDNKVPASMAKRLEGLKKLNQKLEVVKQENKQNATEESQEKLEEILEFIEDTQDDLIEDLSELVAKKREADLKNRQIVKNREQEEARFFAERKARLAKENQQKRQKELEEETLEEKPKSETEKKSGIGWGGLIIGGALLILSAGAINHFANKK